MMKPGIVWLALPWILAGAVGCSDDGAGDAVVLWADPSGTAGDGAASYTMPANGPYQLHQWDFGVTGTTEQREPAGGAIALTRTSTPVILVGDGS